MDNFKHLCEMDIAGLMKTMMGAGEEGKKKRSINNMLVAKIDSNVDAIGNLVVLLGSLRAS